MKDQGSPQVHHDMLMLLSGVVAFERMVPRMTAAEVKAELRALTEQLAAILPNIEAFDQMDKKIDQLERRIRILRLSRGESDNL